MKLFDYLSFEQKISDYLYLTLEPNKKLLVPVTRYGVNPIKDKYNSLLTTLLLIIILIIKTLILNNNNNDNNDYYIY